MKILLQETQKEHFSQFSQSVWDLAEPPEYCIAFHTSWTTTIFAGKEHKINNHTPLDLNDFLSENHSEVMKKNKTKIKEKQN